MRPLMTYNDEPVEGHELHWACYTIESSCMISFLTRSAKLQYKPFDVTSLMISSHKWSYYDWARYILYNETCCVTLHDHDKPVDKVIGQSMELQSKLQKIFEVMLFSFIASPLILLHYVQQNDDVGWGCMISPLITFSDEPVNWVELHGRPFEVMWCSCIKVNIASPSLHYVQ